MDLFVWDRSFGTGLPEMDDQHRGLIDIFNELHRTLFDPNYPPDRREVSLRRAFDRLMAYARAQFAAEESMMQTHGLDARHVAVHRRQHEQFIINLRELWGERDTRAEWSARMMGFLSSWIGLHVLGVDQSMVRQLRTCWTFLPLHLQTWVQCLSVVQTACSTEHALRAFHHFLQTTQVLTPA